MRFESTEDYRNEEMKNGFKYSVDTDYVEEWQQSAGGHMYDDEKVTVEITTAHVDLYINEASLEKFKELEKNIKYNLRNMDNIIYDKICMKDDLKPDEKLLEYLHKNHSELVVSGNDNYRKAYEEISKTNKVRSAFIALFLVGALAVVSVAAGLSIAVGAAITGFGALIGGLGYYGYSTSKIYENTSNAYSNASTENLGSSSNATQAPQAHVPTDQRATNNSLTEPLLPQEPGQEQKGPTP